MSHEPVFLTLVLPYNPTDFPSAAVFILPTSFLQHKQHNTQLELSTAICIIYSHFHPKSRNTQVRVKAADCAPSENTEDPLCVLDPVQAQEE